MKAVFIDECKAKKYILCAAIVSNDKVPAIRLALARLRMPGQTKIHFVNESDSRRKQILGAFQKLDVEFKFWISNDPSELTARQNCLKAMVESLDSSDVHQIWLDRDINHVSTDRLVISRELRHLGLQNQVEFRHSSGGEQNLLWLPDGLSWVKNRGGNWSKLLKNFNVKIHILD